MLYIGVCDLCGFLLIFEDIDRFKQEVATHFDTSHGADFGCFVSNIPLREFEEINIFRIRDKKEIARIKMDMKNPAFWYSFRNRFALAEARV